MLEPLPSPALANNQRFYDSLWSGTDLYGPESFNTWPLLSSLSRLAPSRLEIGPGLRPRLPISGTNFIDLSSHAVSKLNSLGGIAYQGNAEKLEFENTSVDLVCAFDVIEHLPDDELAFSEISRVLKTGGAFVFSVPLHTNAWSTFDEIVGHCRRYDEDALSLLLLRHGFKIEQSAAFGLKPRNRFLTRFGLWWLKQFPKTALAYYNRYLFPYALKKQTELVLNTGLAPSSDCEGKIFVCRKI